MSLNSEFMNKLSEKLLEKDLSEKTVNLILQQLKSLNNNESFNNLNFLKNKEEILKRLEAYGRNTQKTYLSSITTTLGLEKKNKLYEHYKELLNRRVQEYNEKDKNEKNLKEEENWVSMDEITEIKNKLLNLINEIGKTKKITKKDWENILSYFILSLYTDLPPRRNQDYQYCYIKKTEKGLDDDKNYLILDSDKFIFNKFKTSKSIGKQEIDFKENQEFKKALSIYLKHHPLLKGTKINVPLLVDAEMMPLMSVNAITRILNKIFKKKVGSSMLRKIYLTSKFGDELEKLKEMRASAKAMGHSEITAQKVYIKNL
jgi:hypothetical protein